MEEFNIGDLVQFIPSGFNRSLWKYCLVGIGYIESIEYVSTLQEDGMQRDIRIYKVFCGRVMKQQMNNFAELELRNMTFQFTDHQMQQICTKASLEKIDWE